MSEKPGIMIYFDLLPVLDRMPFEDRGILLYAMVYYGKHGEIPVLPPNLQLVWPLVQFRLDSDERRYTETVNRRKYAAYTRWTRKKGLEPESYTQWLLGNGHLEPEKEPEEDYLAMT